MYKVFVDNVPICFQKNGSFKSNLPKIFFPSLPLTEFDTFVREINTLNSNEKIFINSPDSSSEIAAFFKNFQWIESAGGIVTNTKTDALLFIFRNGIWDLPKGKIEEGEVPREAALREIKEECGIHNMTVEHALSPTHHVYFAYGKYWIKKTFWFALTSPEIEVQPQQEEGITEAKWIQENQIDTIRQNTYGSILDVMKEYLKH